MQPLSNTMQYYKYKNPTTNTIEAVKPEVWQWEAIYKDGSILKQFDDNGYFHRFSEIDQSQLHVFRMVSDENPQSYSILFNPSKMKLIHYYKNTIFHAATPYEQRVRSYVFGYEMKAFPTLVKIKQLFVITPENELIVTDDINKITFEPTPMQDEQ
jgi:hypothetical protein